MKKLAFISRHAATPDQIALASEKGYELVPVGDRDAFAVSPGEFAAFSGAVVVHPAMAIRLQGATPNFVIGVFENGNRAGEGEKPAFFAKALHLYGQYGCRTIA